MKVVFSGSRDWIDQAVPRQIVTRVHRAGASTIAHGDARGFDRVIDLVAREPGLFRDTQIHKYSANWDLHGKAAGYYRNVDMLRKEEPDLVVAAPLAFSKGTWHAVAFAECPSLVFIGGCRDEIAKQANAMAGWAAAGVCDEPTPASAAAAWVQEKLVQACASARWIGSDHPESVTMPRHDRPWWVLVVPKCGGDVLSLPLLEALLR